MIELPSIQPNLSPIHDEESQKVCWCCDRDRTVSLLKSFLPIIEGGAYLSLACDGFMNAFFAGIPALAQVVIDENTEYAAKGGIALLVGIVEGVVAYKLLSKRVLNKIGTDLTSVFPIAIGGAATIYISGQIARQVVDLSAVKDLSEAAWIAIGVSIKAVSGLPIGAGIAVVVFIGIKSVIAGKRAYDRRNNPAGENLI